MIRSSLWQSLRSCASLEVEPRVKPEHWRRDRAEYIFRLFSLSDLSQKCHLFHSSFHKYSSEESYWAIISLNELVFVLESGLFFSNHILHINFLAHVKDPFITASSVLVNHRHMNQSKRSPKAWLKFAYFQKSETCASLVDQHSLIFSSSFFLISP